MCSQQVCRADNLATICEPTVYKMWQPRHLTTLWASMACYRDTFAFYLTFACSLLAHISAWNTVVYCPTVKLSLLHVSYPYIPAPVPLFALEPSVYQTSFPLSIEWEHAFPFASDRRSDCDYLQTGDLTVTILLCACLTVILSVLIYRIGSSFMIQGKQACPYPLDLDFQCPLQQSVVSQLGFSDPLHSGDRPRRTSRGICQTL
jgi:hypothetical protein